MATVSGGFIAAHFGYDAPMRFYVLPAMAAFVLACTLKEPPMSAAGAPRPSYISILREGWRFFVKSPVLMLLTAELSFTNALAWGLIWLFQPLLASAGLPVAYYGVVHAAACIGHRDMGTGILSPLNSINYTFRYPCNSSQLTYRDTFSFF